jgi:hypothetical protein
LDVQHHASETVDYIICNIIRCVWFVCRMDG